MSAPDVSVVARWTDAGLEELPQLLADVADPELVVQAVVLHSAERDADLPAGVVGVQVRGRARTRARALGLSAATGRAVVFVEPGDRLRPEALRAALRALDADPSCAFVHGRTRTPGHRGPVVGPTRLIRDDHEAELLQGGTVGPSCGVLFRRSALLAAGIPAAGAAALTDEALCLRLVRTAHAVGVSEVLAEHHRPAAARDALAAVRAQRWAARRHARTRAARRKGLERLLVARALELAQDVRHTRSAPGRGARASLALTLLLARSPRAVPALVRAEVGPWLRRRRPGSCEPPVGGRAGSRLALVPAVQLAEAVRFSVPPGAAVIVLGRAGETQKLGDRPARAATPAVWGRTPGTETYVAIGPAAQQEVARTPEAADRLASEWQQLWSGEAGSIHRARTAAPDTADRVLVAGYFSFEDAHATAGDLLVRDQVCSWLAEAGRHYDVALAAPFVGGVDWRTVDPHRYSQVVFACGPFGPQLPSWVLLERFPHARTVGVNLSMLEPLADWNPLDAVVERDSDRAERPDVAFTTPRSPVPVIGVCLRGHAPGTRIADAAIRRLLAAAPMAVVPVDTRLDAVAGGANSTGLRTAEEVEALLARMDVVVTTRLHGLVLALKNGVPVVAVDPGNEGDKIVRQARSVGWPAVLHVDELTDEALQRALDFCRTPQARALAAACAERGRAAGDEVRRLLLVELARGSTQPVGAGTTDASPVRARA